MRDDSFADAILETRRVFSSDNAVDEDAHPRSELIRWSNHNLRSHADPAPDVMVASRPVTEVYVIFSVRDVFRGALSGR